MNYFPWHQAFLSAVTTISLLSASAFPTAAAQLIGGSPNTLTGQQAYGYGWQYGYYENNVFHAFTSSQWDGSAWMSPMGGFNSTGGWISPSQIPLNQRLTQRWLSPFNGNVNLSINLTNISNITGSPVELIPYIDGVAQPKILADAQTSTNPTEFSTRVTKGSSIDFVFSTANNQPVNFSFSANILAPSGISFVDFPNPLPFDVGCSIDAVGRCSNPLPFNKVDFQSAYVSVGGSFGILGDLIGTPYQTQGVNGYTGWRQDTTGGGAIFQSRYGSHPVFGGIGHEFLNLTGGERGLLGFPTSGEINRGNGIIIQNYQNGIIVYDGINPTRVEPLTSPVGYPQKSGHVGLFEDSGKIIEAFLTETNPWFDPYKGERINVQGTSGVQAQHTLGSFINRSPAYQGSPTTYQNHIVVDQDYLNLALQKAQSALGSPFLDTRLASYSCTAQKGGLGSYSNVGLVEGSFEGNQKLNGREGFIDNVIECFRSPYRERSIGLAPIATNSSSISAFLSPGFLEYAIVTDLWKYKSDWLRGIFEADEIVITDPLGRKIIYRDGGLSYINEIPDSEKIFFEVDHVFDSIFPEANQAPNSLPAQVRNSSTTFLFDGQDAAVSNSAELDTCPQTKNETDPRNNPPKLRQHIRLFIPKRLPGQYIFEMFSRDGHSQASFGDQNETTIISANRCPNPAHVPEPSGLIGLLLFPIIGWKLRKSRVEKSETF